MKRWFLAILALFAFAGSASADDAVVQSDHSRAVLSAEHPSVAPGESVWVALTFDFDAGWHSYWRTPGDAGEPIQIKWTLPPGVTAGEIQWPIPERFDYSGIAGFGYTNHVMLLTELKIDRSVAPAVIPVKADATWLTCADVCIPDEGSFTLPIKIDPAAAGQNTKTDAAFDATREMLPGAAPWPVKATRSGNTLVITAGPGLAVRALKEATYFPYDGTLISNGAKQDVRLQDGTLELKIPLMPAADKIGEAAGVLRLDQEGGAKPAGYSFAAPIAWTGPATTGAAAGIPAETSAATSNLSLAMALLLALAGGIILNIMPCVLPVLVMKALSFASAGGANAARLRRDGLVYTAGVVTAFTVLIAVLLGLRAAGAAVGWGFQLQSPVFVAALAYVILALGLNMAGVFNIDGPMGIGESLTRRHGASGAFFTGLLAVVVATPCTAPFMGTAIGFALTQSTATTIAVFEALAIGLALPYLVLSFAPGAVRLLPRPGAWMKRFKQLLAFPMFAVTAWLLWVLAQQVDAVGLAAAFAGVVVLGMAAWLWGTAQTSAARGRRWATAFAVLALMGTGILAWSLGASAQPKAAAAASATGGMPMEPFTKARLAALRAEGRPVLVDFTAAWCITCLVNERVALSTRDVAQALERKNVVYMKADWTNRDADIGALLRGLGRDGVPVYALYGKGGAEPTLLPQVLTPSIVVEALEKL